MSNVANIRPMNYTAQQLDLIKRTVASDCNNDEFNLFVEVAKRVGLDMFRKQIYAVIYNKDDAKKRKMSIITGIDGLRAVAARGGNYRPSEDATTFEQCEKSTSNPAGISRAFVKCWRLGADLKWHAVAGEAYWDEYAPMKEDADAFDYVETGGHWPDGNPKKRKVPRPGAVVSRVPEGKWATMPHVMLAKCAEAQALRKGWPEDLSGIYTPEEMDQARFIDMPASEAVEAFERDQRLQLTKSRESVFVVWAPLDPLEAVPIGQFADRAASFVRGCTEFSDLQGWQDQNRVALQDFWARSKSDALGLKKIIEERETELLGGPKK